MGKFAAPCSLDQDCWKKDGHTGPHAYTDRARTLDEISRGKDAVVVAAREVVTDFLTRPASLAAHHVHSLDALREALIALGPKVSEPPADGQEQITPRSIDREAFGLPPLDLGQQVVTASELGRRIAEAAERGEIPVDPKRIHVGLPGYTAQAWSECPACGQVSEIIGFIPYRLDRARLARALLAWDDQLTEMAADAIAAAYEADGVGKTPAAMTAAAKTLDDALRGTG